GSTMRPGAAPPWDSTRRCTSCAFFQVSEDVGEGPPGRLLQQLLHLLIRDRDFCIFVKRAVRGRNTSHHVALRVTQLEASLVLLLEGSIIPEHTPLLVTQLQLLGEIVQLGPHNGIDDHPGHGKFSLLVPTSSTAVQPGGIIPRLWARMLREDQAARQV